MDKARLIFRQAVSADITRIWEIIRHAIARRREEGSTQWQDGYPSEQTIRDDISAGVGYVLENDGNILAYTALIRDIEPAYEAIEGKWLTDAPYMVIHRVAVADEALGQGLASEIFKRAELITAQMNIPSIRVDTNFDNAPMLHLLEKAGYVYCGTVYFRGEARMAYEKVI